MSKDDNRTQQAENELQQAQEQLRLIIENIKDHAVFTVDLDGFIRTWNSGAERLFGYSGTEAVGQNVAIIFTDEDRALRVPEYEMQKALASGYANDERWHVRKDQSRFFASGIMRPLVNDDGQIQGFLKVAQDITMRKQTEAYEHEQRMFAEALHECALVLTRTQKLEEGLDSILGIVGRVMQHDAAYILVIDGSSINAIRTSGFSANDTAALSAQLQQGNLALEAFRPLYEVTTTRRPLVTNVEMTPADHLSLPGSMDALLAVPLIVEDEVIGLLIVMRHTLEFYNERDSQHLQAFAYHAASTIRNAQLYQQAQELAALQERQQLARDLHDAVAQTLFTASVLVEVLPLKWENEPEQVPEGMEQLNQLIKGALSEMRTLILELRPNNVETTPLTQLLAHLVNAVQGRKQMTITMNLDGEPVLPAEVHMGVYRLAQEALNNMTKHSRATRTSVEMHGSEGQVELRIRDDGIGFSPEHRSSGLGLQMMRERAEALEAVLKITSSEGAGTEVYVRWPAFSEPVLGQ
jgi:PAS domain S-box-containing protein